MEISFLNMILKILYVVCGLKGNVKHPATSFLDEDEVFQLAAISQCEGGGGWTQVMRFA
jgi:hypothetical protein